jgi:hypothetical protein
MEPTKRVDAGGAWDRLPEEIISMVTIKVAETSEKPLKDLHGLWWCNMAMKRASSSRDIANRFNLEHHYQLIVSGDADTLDTYLHTIDWLQGANNEKSSSSRGWATYAWAVPVVLHFSHEQKRRETYRRLTFWPSSSTTSTAPPRMFSSTFDTFTVRSLLIHRSEDGGGWRMGPTMRMMHVSPECTTKSRRR